MVYVFLVVTIALFFYLFSEIQKEKKRNRILQSFLSGLISSMSDYVSKTDMADISSASDIAKIYDKKFPIPYTEILRNVTHEFEKDFLLKSFWTWIKDDRNLFYDNKYANDGFNMIYWDFHDYAIEQIKKAQEIEAKSKKK